MNKYTSEHIEYIAANINGRSYKELTNMFNEHFGLKLKVSAIKAVIARHHLRNNRNTRFKKGDIPFNKGKKVNYPGSIATQFKPGLIPHNHKPVGSERVVDGYTEVKIAEPKTWRGKHRVIWEKANGPIPKGYVLIFADNNRQNITLDNLILISRRELVVLNRRGLIFDNAELTKTGTIIASIHLKMTDRKNAK